MDRVGSVEKRLVLRAHDQVIVRIIGIIGQPWIYDLAGVDEKHVVGNHGGDGGDGGAVVEEAFEGIAIRISEDHVAGVVEVVDVEVVEIFDIAGGINICVIVVVVICKDAGDLAGGVDELGVAFYAIALKGGDELQASFSGPDEGLTVFSVADPKTADGLA